MSRKIYICLHVVIAQLGVSNKLSIERSVCASVLCCLPPKPDGMAQLTLCS